MKNRKVLLSLALVSILSACGTKTSPSTEASKNTNVDPITTDVVIPTKESSITLLCLEGGPDLPGAPQDEAGLTRKFET